MLLDELAVGATAVVTKVGGEGRMRRHLLDMGITPGVEMYLRKRAPFGDPIEITIRGYELSLRKDVALCFAVEMRG